MLQKDYHKDEYNCFGFPAHSVFAFYVGGLGWPGY